MTAALLGALTHTYRVPAWCYCNWYTYSGFGWSNTYWVCNYL